MISLGRLKHSTYLLLFLAMASVPSIAKPETERIPLWQKPVYASDGVTKTDNAYITCFLPDQPNGTAVIICPGEMPEPRNRPRRLWHRPVAQFAQHYRYCTGIPTTRIGCFQTLVRCATSDSHSPSERTEVECRPHKDRHHGIFRRRAPGIHRGYPLRSGQSKRRGSVESELPPGLRPTHLSSHHNGR